MNQELNLGQLFAFGFDGYSLPCSARDLLVQQKASGVVLFKRNIDSLEQLINLNASITNLSVPGLPHIISVDQEGGRVARLNNICTPIQSARDLANKVFDDFEHTYRVGAMMAREMVSLGFNLDFAPVLDVDTNPKNPIIGDRSFSKDPHIAARLGANFIRGMQEAGLGACGKHFPGHGDTSLDSHLSLPQVTKTWRQLKKTEIVPFQEAIKQKVACLMTAHVVYDQLDSEFPATLSKNILQNILRGKMGFSGLLISDDLNMKAIADYYTLKETLKLALLAGVDLFLICEHENKVAEAINLAHALYESGEVPKERFEEALGRVRIFKNKFIGMPEAPDLEEAKMIVRSNSHLRLMK